VSQLFILISTGQRDDTISSESRRHRHSGEDSYSPKAANGPAIRPASASGSSNESDSARPKLVSEVNEMLLVSGAVILPGRQPEIQTQLISAAFIKRDTLFGFISVKLNFHCLLLPYNHFIKVALKS